jgi:hypothetical protein
MLLSICRAAYHCTYIAEGVGQCTVVLELGIKCWSSCCCRYEHMAMPEGALQGDALVSHYSGLIAKYIGEDNLFW